MQTAITCATIDPPVWPGMHYDAGDESRLSKLHRLLFGREEADDDDGQTYPTGHHCFYRALAEGALDIITVVDEFGTIVYTSPSSEQHLGYQPDELIGRNLFEFVHSDDIPRVRAAFDECRTERHGVGAGREPAAAHRTGSGARSNRSAGFSPTAPAAASASSTRATSAPASCWRLK